MSFFKNSFNSILLDFLTNSDPNQWYYRNEAMLVLEFWIVENSYHLHTRWRLCKMQPTLILLDIKWIKCKDIWSDNSLQFWIQGSHLTSWMFWIVSEIYMFAFECNTIYWTGKQCLITLLGVDGIIIIIDALWKNLPTSLTFSTDSIFLHICSR